MKLARNFSLVLALAVLCVLVGVFTFQVERDMDVMVADVEADHRLLGTALAGSISNAWRVDGEASAFETLAQANRFQGLVKVRWVWLDGTAAEALPRVSLSELQSLGSARFLAFQPS